MMLMDNEIYKEIGMAIAYTLARGFAFNIFLPLWYALIKIKEMMTHGKGD